MARNSKWLMFLVVAATCVCGSLAASMQYELPMMEATTGDKRRSQDDMMEKECPSDKECNMASALKSVFDYLKVLSEDMKELKEAVASSCSAVIPDDDMSGDGSGEDGSGEMEDGSGEMDEGSGIEEEGSGEEDTEEKMDEETEEYEVTDGEYVDNEDGTDDEEVEEEKEDVTEDEEVEEEKEDGTVDEEVEEEKVDETTPEEEEMETLPPPPERCPPPFQLLAKGCFYIQTDNREWRSWGDANDFCQQQGGALASPYRPEELMEYLHQSYSGAIWVGGQLEDGDWKWLNGQSVKKEHWKQRSPNANPGRKCMLLDSREKYLANNFFCGEKFSFICEHPGDAQLY